MARRGSKKQLPPTRRLRRSHQAEKDHCMVMLMRRNHGLHMLYLANAMFSIFYKGRSIHHICLQELPFQHMIEEAEQDVVFEMGSYEDFHMSKSPLRPGCYVDLPSPLPYSPSPIKPGCYVDLPADPFNNTLESGNGDDEMSNNEMEPKKEGSATPPSPPPISPAFPHPDVSSSSSEEPAEAKTRSLQKTKQIHKSQFHQDRHRIL